MPHQLKTLEDLKPAPYNPREITPDAAAGLSASVAQFGDISGIVWNKRSGHLVSGHQRLEALTARGGAFKTGPPRIILGDETFAVRVVDWDAPTEKAANVAANNPHIAGAFTDDLQGILASLQDDVPAFDELRLDLLFEVGEGGGGKENPYTNKVVSPIYEPSGEKPAVAELVDTEKRDALLAKIRDADGLSEDAKSFLSEASQRMLVFNYQNIANYYAHADAEEQELFERLALIIIDFDKAIEYGFVKMSEEIKKTYTGGNGDAE